MREKWGKIGAKIKSLCKRLLVWFICFIVALFVGEEIFPVDEANNVVVMPPWYGLIVAFALPIFAALNYDKLFGKKLKNCKKSSPVIHDSTPEMSQKPSWEQYHLISRTINSGKKVRGPQPTHHVLRSTGTRTEEKINPVNTPDSIQAHIPVVKSPIHSQRPTQSPQVEKPVAPKAPKKSSWEIMDEMEKDFQNAYQFAFDRMLNKRNCIQTYKLLVKKWGGEDQPIIVQVRFEQLCEMYEPKFNNPNPMLEVDNMSGHQFEEWCANLLRINGYSNVCVTQGSHDQGVDVLAEQNGIHYAIQCKCYSSDLGNTPIQEVNTGKAIYHCQIGVVMTNRYFTKGAKEAAEATGVLLWDRDALQKMMGLQKREWLDLDPALQ